MLNNLDIKLDKNKLIRFAVLLGIFIVSTIVVYFLIVNPLIGDSAKGLTYTVTLDVQTNVSDTLTLYYDNLDYSRYDEEHKNSVNVKGMKSFQTVSF